MAACKGKTKDGQACNMAAIKGERYCFAHSPERARQRAEANSKGGRHARPEHAGDTALLPAQIKTLQDAEGILRYALAELVPLDNSINRVRALVAIYLAAVKGVELGEIEQRIAALEMRL